MLSSACFIRNSFSQQFNVSRRIRFAVLMTLCILVAATAISSVSYAQGPTDGAFNGVIKDLDTGATIPNARVVFRNRATGFETTATTKSDGTFSKTALPTGEYEIEVSASGYVTDKKVQKLYAMDYYRVEPVPFTLAKVREPVAIVPPKPVPVVPGQPTPAPVPVPVPTPALQTTGGESEKLSLSTRNSGTFDDRLVVGLPLGSKTLTRTFDDLALLLPGVTLPPLTIGNGSGPGQGAGVGSAGQFSVNGMRGRSNNFTVDGSDNNDEDIGVRRQGFFSLVPQPIESIQEYQVTTLLAPAQYGRNFGGQVNAVSKSGGNVFHGTAFGFFNSSRLNARDAFDTANGTATTAVTASTNFSGTTYRQPVLLDGNPLTVTNQSGGKDPFKLGQGGFVLGGPIKKDKAFFFVSFETQILNARKEASFAVPTVEQRGIFGTGATGIFADCRTTEPGFNISSCNPANSSHYFPEFGFPTTAVGDAVFSLFPFANNPTGVYGPNTYTESLPADARGNVISGKYDQNFSFLGKPQAFTARYNFTQDRRIIPVTGAALFSSLRPRVRTQNFSTILNTQISSRISNVLRLSYGRTRLAFDEVRDPFLVPSQISPNEPFLLNARTIFNNTINPFPMAGSGYFIRSGVRYTGIPNTGPVIYQSGGTTELTES